MGGSIFSPNHENQPGQPTPPRRRRRNAAQPPIVEPIPLNSFAVPIKQSVENPAISEQTRRNLRARQLMGRQGSIGQELSSDLRRDQVKTLDRYDTQLGQTVVPEISPNWHGVGPGEKHSEHLSHDDDFHEVERDQDLRMSSVTEEENLKRFAALSAFDQVLQSFDTQLTACFTSVRTLKQFANQLKVRMSREQQNPQLSEIAGEIYLIIDTAVEPWLLEVESYFNKIADQTVEGVQE